MKLEEVAKRAKVSTATVSRVLNNLDVVKSSTRQRVLRAVEELNYHPNLLARNLAGGKNSTLGVILSNLENPFFFDIFRSIEAHAAPHGYDVVVANTDYRAERLISHIRLMIGRRVGGLALIVSEMEPNVVDDLTGYKIPVVFYDVGSARRNISNVRVDYRRGIDRVVEYLYHFGHRRMAFVGHHTTLGPTSAREKSFLEAVARHAPDIQCMTVANSDGLEGGRDAARDLLSSGFDPTAIICVNDFMAAGVLRHLRERGLRVPADVSVTGFDNIKLSEFCDPPLTTLHIPREKIGQLVVEALAPESGKPRLSSGREISIDPELVLRESTGPARK